jgi:hypothetical protein
MATAKQIAANRLNSQKNTGPRSAQGKAISRFNALRHGIFAVHQIMFDEKPEDLAELSANTSKLMPQWGRRFRLPTYLPTCLPTPVPCRRKPLPRPCYPRNPKILHPVTQIWFRSVKIRKPRSGSRQTGPRYSPCPAAARGKLRSLKGKDIM